MKKIRVLAMVLLSAVLFSTSFLGCKHDPTTPVTPDNTTTNDPGNTDTPATTDDPSNSDTPAVTPVAATALQAQIDSASPGSTVTLSASTVSAGAYVTISKALTVNGNNIEGLTVIVSPSVASGVTLKNFKNATIRVGTPSSGRSARSARAAADDELEIAPVDDEDAIAFKKFGDEALPLFLEGCTIEKLEAEADLALYLGNGDKKSEIDELCLKEGVEDFTFVEFDKADKPETTADEKTEKDDKTLVKKLSIEDDGIKEINLIGGTFSDVDYAADFAGNVDFKYDKEFEADQFDFGNDAAAAEKKEAFMDKFEPEDIALAKNEGAGTASAVNDVYSFTIPSSEFDKVNGAFGIIFLTQNQATVMQSEGNVAFLDYITFKTPAYDMSLMGAFTVKTGENGSIANGLHAVYGASEVFFDYTNTVIGAMGVAGMPKTTTLDKYMTYSKEAVVIDVQTDNVIVYVNKSAVRKSDLLLCSGYRPNDADDNVTGSSEGGTKLSNIDLYDYTPYFVLYRDQITGADPNSLLQNCGALMAPNSGGQRLEVEIPTANKTAFLRNYNPFNMSISSTAYPDVSNVVYPDDIVIDNVKITVQHYSDALVAEDSERVIRENVAPNSDPYEYYFDSNFTQMIYCPADIVNWEDIYEAKGWTDETDVTIYARPLRNITLETDHTVLLGEGSRLAQINFGSDNTGYKLFTTYDSATDTYSGVVTNPKDLVVGTTYYVSSQYYNVWLAGTEEGTEPVFWKRFEQPQALFMQLGNQISPVAMYSSAVITNSNKFTSTTLQNAAFGTKVYVLSPKVVLNPHWEDGEYVGDEELYFADFYAYVASESCTETYYYLQNGYNESGNSISTTIQITKAVLDNLLQTTGVTFDGFGDFFIYDSDPNADDGNDGE